MAISDSSRLPTVPTSGGVEIPAPPVAAPPPLTPREVAHQAIGETARHTQDFLAQQRESWRTKSLLGREIPELAPLVTYVQGLEGEGAGGSFLSNLNLGSQQEGTTFEGGNAMVPVQWMDHVLGIVEGGQGLFTRSAATSGAYRELHSHVENELIPALTDLKEFVVGRLTKEAYVTKLRQQITTLQPGESFTMPGGFIDIPEGHRMYYRFEKQPRGKIRIYIYNAALAQGGEVVSDQRGLRERCLPYEVIDGVTESELFARVGDKPKQSVIERLVELQKPVENHQGRDSADVKDAFMANPAIAKKFLPSDVVRRTITSKLISTQASGNCTQKSLNCVALDLVPRREDFKLLTRDSRFLSLVAYFRANKERLAHPTSNDQTMVAELELAARNFLNKLDRALAKDAEEFLVRSRGDITPPTQEEYDAAFQHAYSADYEIAYATINELLEQIEQAKEPGFPPSDYFPVGSLTDLLGEEVGPPAAPLPGPESMAMQPSSQALSLKGIHKYTTDSLRDLNPDAATVIPPPYQYAPLLGQNCTWPDLLNVLGTLRDIIQGSAGIEGLAASDPQAAAWQIETVLRNLGHLKLAYLKKASMKGLTPAQAQATQRELENILDLYAKISRQNGEPLTPAKMATLDEFIALSYCLALNADSATKQRALKKFGVSRGLIAKQVLWTEDAQTYRQQQQLAQFFAAINKGKDNHLILQRPIGVFDDRDVQENELAEANLWSKYIDAPLRRSPIGQKQLDPQEFSFKPDDALKYKLVASLKYDDVPPELQHITALRRTILRARELGRRGSNLEKGFDPDRAELTRIGSKSILFGYLHNPWQRDIPATDYGLKLEDLNDYTLHVAEAGKRSGRELMLQCHQIQSVVPQKTENEALAEGFDPLDVAASESSLSPATLLLTLKNHLDKLSDPAWRQKINALLFRFTAEANQETLHDYLAANPQIVQQLDDLTRTALLLFKTRRPRGQEKTDELLFILRLRAKLCQSIATKHPLPEETQSLNKVCLLLLDDLMANHATDPSFIPDEIHLAKAGLLQTIMPPPPNRTPFRISTAADLFYSLANVRQGVRAPADKPFLLNVTALIPQYTLTWQSLAKQPQALNRFANQLLKKYYPKSPDLNWRCDPTGSQITASDGDHTWTIDLARTEIFHRDGATPPQTLGGGRITKLPEGFQRLFGEPNFTCTKEGNCLYFRHPKFGECRIVKDTLIQRKIASQWYTFFLEGPSDEIDKIEKHLGPTLTIGHDLWVSSNQPPEMLISNTATGEIRYHVDLIGDVHPARLDGGQVVIDRTQILLQPAASQLPKPIQRWLQIKNETPRTALQLSLWSRSAPTVPRRAVLPTDGRNVPLWDQQLPPDILELPTFGLAGSQSTLRFHRGSDDKWHYDADPRFVIDDSRQPALDEHFGTYLCLINAAGQRKVLIPVGDVAAKGFSPRCSITPKQDRDNLPTRFFEYDFNGTALTARDLGANLYLAQLYLAQHRYPEALEIIQTRISVSEPIPDADKKLLAQLANQLVYPTSISDDSPTSCAIRLNAFLKLQSIWPQLDLTKADPKTQQPPPLPDLETIYKTYLGRLSSIPHGLVLPTEEEKKLINIVGADKFPERYDFLYSPTSYRTRIRTSFETAKPGLKTPRPIRTLLASGIDRTRFQQASLAAPPATVPVLTYLGDNDVFYRSWHDRLMVAPPPQPEGQTLPTPLQTSSFASSIEAAAQADPLHAAAIRQHGAFYLGDSQTAAKKQLALARLKTDDRPLLEGAQRAMTAEKARAEADSERMARTILAIANSLGTQASPAQLMGHLVRRGADAKKPIELRELLWAATIGPTAIKGLNPLLSSEEATSIQHACLEYMVEATHAEHLGRALKPLGDYLAAPLGSEAQAQHQKALEDQLREKRTYDPSLSRNYRLLYFECVSHLRLREQQATIVNGIITPPGEPGGKRDNVFQVMMGGGKSSVIFPNAINTLADTSGRPVFIVSNPAQYASAQGNLTTTFRETFGKDVYSIELSSEEFGDPKTLTRTIQRIKEAQAKKCPIHLTTTMARTLQLRLDVERQRLEDIHEPAAEKSQMALIGQLQEINDLFASGSAFFDECDISMGVLSAVNIPSGPRQHVRPARIATVKEFYRHLVAHPDLLQRTGLLRNEQPNLSEEAYRREILPTIASDYFAYPPLGLSSHPELQAAFVRFLQTPYKKAATAPVSPEELGQQITEEDERLAANPNTDLSTLTGVQRENVLFLRLLDQWLASPDPQQREQAQQITLLRGFLNEVAPFTLQESCNGGYGRNSGADNGAVVPWNNGRAEPSNQFGYHYTALAYHFQTALNTPISEGEVLFLAQGLAARATEVLRTRPASFETTEAAQLFTRLTGQPLTPFSNPDSPAARQALARVLAYINDPAHLERRLDIEELSAREHVTYYPATISSSSVDLPEQFGHCIACSGTLWNTRTFNRRLQTPVREEGTEGSIFNLLLQRAIGAQTLRTIPEGNLESLLQLIRTYVEERHPKPLRGIIDAGNFLWEQDTEIAARGILDLYDGIKPPGGVAEIDAVIYFQAGSFYLLRRGSGPERLNDTTPEEIRRVARDLPMSKIFTLYDKARATGTDIRQDPDSVNLITIDPQMTARTDLQGDLRLRGLADRQDLISVVTAGGKQKMINRGETLADVLATQVRTEAVALSEQTYRAYLLEIQNVVKKAARRKLDDASENAGALREAIGRYKSVLFEDQEDDPFGQYRAIGHVTDPATQLEARKNQILAKLPPELREEVEAELNGLVEQARTDRLLPRAVPAGGAGTAVQTQVTVQQQTQLAVEQSVQQELQQEEELYNYQAEGRPAKEKLWLGIRELNRHLTSASAACRGRCQTPSGVLQTDRYAELFPDDFFMTNNFRQTLTAQIPIFHRLNKEAKFVLLIKTPTGYQKVLLSQYDAAVFREINKEDPIKGAWLFSIDGVPVERTQLPKDPNFGRHLAEGLWYANLYNGNISYLEMNRDLTERLMGPQPEKRALFRNFAALRAGIGSPRGQMAIRSPLFRMEVAAAA